MFKLSPTLASLLGVLALTPKLPKQVNLAESTRPSRANSVRKALIAKLGRRQGIKAWKHRIGAGVTR